MGRDTEERTLLLLVLSLVLNIYVVPVVSELNELWEDGIEVCHSGSPRIPERFFAALLLVACDVPAARKLCGFLLKMQERIHSR